MARKSRRQARNVRADVATPARSQGTSWPARTLAAVIVLVGVVPMANLVTTGVGLPWFSAAVRQWLLWNTIIIGGAYVAARFLPAPVEQMVGTARRWLLAPTQRQFEMLVGAVVLGLAVYFSWRIYALAPSAGDEWSQRWQAHLLTMGRLFAHRPAHAEFFDTNETLDVDGRWFSQFPIGGPAFLALGMLVRAPWLVNPALAAVSVAAVYRFARAVIDDATARGATIILALSPFLLFMAGSQMNHVATLACIWIAFAALPAWISAADSRRASQAGAMIGVSLGIAATIRPYDAAITAVVMGVFQVREVMRRRDRARSLIVQGVVGALPVALLLGANWVTTGHPFSFGYDVLNGVAHRPGFHVTPQGFSHTPRRGLYIISAYLLKLDVGLLGWAVPGMLLVACGLALIARPSRWDSLLASFVAATFVGYSLYWSESYFVGPRFLFCLIPVFALYIARLPGALNERLQSPAARRAVMMLIPLWITTAWALPANTEQQFGVRHLARMLTAPPELASVIVRSAREAGLSNAVVFVRESWNARLTARLRSLGMRPLIAETFVAESDACTLEMALDVADRQTIPAQQRLEGVITSAGRDAPATALANIAKVDQLAFVQGRALSPECNEQMQTSRSSGVTIAELLPYAELDQNGALGGRVIYARDFGRRNELLREQYRDRLFYRANISNTNGRVAVTFDQYAPGSP